MFMRITGATLFSLFLIACGNGDKEKYLTAALQSSSSQYGGAISAAGGDDGTQSTPTQAGDSVSTSTGNQGTTTTPSSGARSALAYLNSLRTKAGLPAFGSQSYLKAAASNHSEYMLQHGASEGHSETQGRDGFTGEHPSNRTLYAGYASRHVSENISTGDQDAAESIDGLFSAIYHRFGFLSMTHDEVGIGMSHDNQHHHYYTYDMGNSKLRKICSSDPSFNGYGSYYSRVCADESKKIEGNKYRNARDYIKTSAPSLILWPAAKSSDIPPVFYQETPDPLPNDGVTGYPVSVQFNDAKFATAPTVESFTLSDSSGSEVDILTTMDQENDPHNRFDAYKYALFPKKRLEWGSAYNVELIYTSNSTQYTKAWCFQTRSLAGKAERFYRIEGDKDITLNVVAGKSYAIYIVPNDTNDILGGVRYSYSKERPQFDYIDSNTFLVNLTGSNGEYAKFTFGNGQVVTLRIAGSDSATVPANEHCAN